VGSLAVVFNKNSTCTIKQIRLKTCIDYCLSILTRKYIVLAGFHAKSALYKILYSQCLVAGQNLVYAIRIASMNGENPGN
jgi:hypothetical protein